MVWLVLPSPAPSTKLQIHTEQHAANDEFPAIFLVVLQEKHVRRAGEDEQGKEYSGDRYVRQYQGCFAQGLLLRRVRRAMLLRNSRSLRNRSNGRLAAACVSPYLLGRVKS